MGTLISVLCLFTILVFGVQQVYLMTFINEMMHLRVEHLFIMITNDIHPPSPPLPSQSSILFPFSAASLPSPDLFRLNNPQLLLF